MIKKISFAINNISATSVKLMFYGTKFSLLLLLIGVLVYYTNTDYITMQLSLTLIKYAFSLFVQFILGGIAFDCVEKRHK